MIYAMKASFPKWSQTALKKSNCLTIPGIEEYFYLYIVLYIIQISYSKQKTPNWNTSTWLRYHIIVFWSVADPKYGCGGI